MRSTSLVSINFALISSLALMACGGGNSSGDDTSGDDIDAGGGGNPDADNSGFTNLINRDYSIPAGEEIYRCIGIRVPEDMYITTFRASTPVGTHHTVLTIDDNPGGFFGTELGEYDCDVQALGLEMLFASGVGTDDLQFPDGVAIKVEAGRFLHLNLHLFNAGTSTLAGNSGIYVKVVPASEVENEAEMIFAGNMSFTIRKERNTPENPEVISGGCTFDRSATLMAYWPHMHQYAVHQKVTLTQGGVPNVLHDEPFGFADQVNYPIDPLISISPGDSINVDCSYVNTTGQDIQFGDSSTAEMCFTGLYRYPKQAQFLFECAQPQ